jgi:hypothetical protein
MLKEKKQMSDTEYDEMAKSAINTILEKLDEDRIASEIDARVERAAMSFTLASESPCSHAEFHQIIGELACHLFHHGHRFPQDIPADRASAEAMLLVHYAYRDAAADGYVADSYVAAYLDAQDPESGIQTVISRMIQAFRAIEKEEYVDSVFVTHVRARDWEIRCRIVALLQEEWRDVLPQSLVERAPAELADDIRGIVEVCLEGRNMARQIGGHCEFPSCDAKRTGPSEARKGERSRRRQ